MRYPFALPALASLGSVQAVNVPTFEAAFDELAADIHLYVGLAIGIVVLLFCINRLLLRVL